MTVRRLPAPRAALAVAMLAALLAGCGDDVTGAGAGADTLVDGGLPIGGDPDPVVATSTLLVTPSLGQVFSGTVRVIAPGGGGEEVSELARAQTNDNGKAEVEIPADTDGPVIVEVSGNGTATYYDEGQDAPAPLEEGDTIRAVVPEVPADGNVGVTPLTELAVRYLEARHGPLAALTREQLALLAASGEIAAAYAHIRAELAPELGDTSLLSVPTVVGDAADLAALGTSPADLYALKLAALARLAHLNGATDKPMLAITRELGDDLSDGIFDGQRDLEALLPATYDIRTFAAQLAGTADLLAASDDLRALLGTLDNYVSDVIVALGAVDDEGAGDTVDGIVEDIITGPGDLLSSWSGSYNGSWQHTEVFARVKWPFIGWQRDVVTEETLKASTALIVALAGNGCHWHIDTDAFRLGTIQIPYGPAFAVAAEGEARRYSLPVSLSLLDISVSGNTTMETQGVLPTRVALEYAYTGLVREFSYRGACTFSYSG